MMVRIIAMLYSTIELTVVQRNAGLGGTDLRAIAAIGALIGFDYIFGIGG